MGRSIHLGTQAALVMILIAGFRRKCASAGECQLGGSKDRSQCTSGGECQLGGSEATDYKKHEGERDGQKVSN
jgi:hypothetical protein